MKQMGTPILFNRQEAKVAKNEFYRKQENVGRSSKNCAAALLASWRFVFMNTLIEPGVKVDELAHAVIGAAIEAHRQLGPGFLESVYEEALCVELTDREIFFERQKEISVLYKGRPIGKHRIDLLAGQSLIVELKTMETLADIHKAQVISYLKATRLSLGLLINFNVSILKNGIQRIVYTDNKSRF
jgi:GxxExxY protein